MVAPPGEGAGGTFVINPAMGASSRRLLAAGGGGGGLRAGAQRSSMRNLVAASGALPLSSMPAGTDAGTVRTERAGGGDGVSVRVERAGGEDVSELTVSSPGGEVVGKDVEAFRASSTARSPDDGEENAIRSSSLARSASSASFAAGGGGADGGQQKAWRAARQSSMRAIFQPVGT